MRRLEAFRAGYGLCQLAFPTVISRLVLGHQPDRRLSLVIRILGARHLAQALILGAVPASPVLHTGGCVVDSLHSASMVVLAAADPQRRPAAALDALAAGLFAGAEFRAAASRARIQSDTQAAAGAAGAEG